MFPSDKRASLLQPKRFYELCLEGSYEFINGELFFSNCIERLPRLNCIGVNPTNLLFFVVNARLE